MTFDVRARLERVRGEIREASERAHRPDEVGLVAVTKTVSIDRIREAYEAGQRVFGENRVQEGVAKTAELGDLMPDGVWHLVGHLQTNKAKAAVQTFSLIESADSLNLALKLESIGARIGRLVPILLEVNVAAEASKSGFMIEELSAVMEQLMRLQNVELRGLMTVAPLVGNPEDARPVFRALRELRDDLQSHYSLDGFHHLSMGMSADFEVAIAEGATMIRIGRAIFGERPSP